MSGPPEDPANLAPSADLTGAEKHDEGKSPLNLISPIFLDGIANVLAYGAKKYAPHNWRKGLNWSRVIGAAMRHLNAYNRGEDKDPETGLSHLYHLGCCVMFLSEYEQTHPELDDRHKIDPQVAGQELKF